MKKLLFISGLIVYLLLDLSSGIFSQTDFGDAPDPPYPTLLANNGPGHIMVPGFYLGSFLDAEPDGTLGMLSFGDDMNNLTDDEDGIRFLSFLLPGQNCTVEVIASAPGLLNGWIDFDFNAQWTDSYDWIFQDQPVSQGSNILSFQVPANINQGMLTFARFRFSTIPGLGFTSLATDGEVEDYAILLGAPLSQEIFMDPDPSLSYAQNEISLVRISGTTSAYNGLLIAAYNDSPFISGPGMGVSISSDNGTTWTASHLPYPVSSISGIPMAESFDPTIAADDSGNVFVAQIATDGNWFISPSSGLYVYKSKNGGATWDTPVTVDIKPAATTTDSNYRLNDRCQIRIDKYASSPYHNNIYLVWIQDRGNDPNKLYGDIYFSRSTNGGATFTSAKTVNSWDHNMGNMPVHDIAPDGTIYLLWIDYNVKTGGLGTLYLDKSTDGGVTWGNDNQVITVNLPNIYLNYGSDARAKGAAVLRVNPLNSQELYVVYAADADTTNQDEADIWFISSPDGGSTWTNPLRVNDDNTPSDTSDQVLPWMETQGDGTIHIAWYDRRNDPMDLKWDIYYTNSNDGGQTFAVNQKINLASFYTPLVWFSQFAYWDSWMGEYLGLALADYTVYLAYTSRVQDQFGDVLFRSYLFSSAGQEGAEDSWSGTPFFTLYPNPSEAELNVELKSNKNFKLLNAEIYSVYGHLVLKTVIRNQNQFSLPVSDLAPGVYWVKITTGELNGIEKFIKIK